MTLQEKAHSVFAPVLVLPRGFPMYPMLLSRERLVTLCLTCLCAARQRQVTVFYLLHFFLGMVMLFSQ